MDLKKLLIFNEPKKIENFVLEEDSSDIPVKDNGNESNREEVLQQNKNSKQENSQSKNDDTKESKNIPISKSLSENLDNMKAIYSLPTNGDVVIREFAVNIKNKSLSAFIMFIDGTTNTKVIDDNILEPLMMLSALEIKGNDEDLDKYIESHLITHNQIQSTKEMEKVIDEVNYGGCAIFIDTIDTVFLADVKGWISRSVGRPKTDTVVRGPQEAFTEGIRVNTGLIRKILRNENLIVENMSVGERSKTSCALVYIKDIANDSLVNEVRRRIENISVDNLLDSGELEQFIEEASFLPIPQTIATERPDRVVSMLSDGKVAIIVHGSPFAIVVPATLPEIIHSSEDKYIRFPYVNLLRMVRVLGIMVALLLPGLYVAVTNYHSEMIPTELLLAIVASREIIPFPIIIEIILMELAFELIREAAIRIPGPIGSTLGMVGGLILGQAAVAANIASPILIIIVAVTGIGTYAIPDFSLAFALRILRFVYILLGGFIGFIGIAIGLFIQGLWFLSAKSFGVPIFSPIAPVASMAFYNDLTRAPIWKQERRPDFLNTKDKQKQSHISRKWDTKEDKESEENRK